MKVVLVTPPFDLIGKGLSSKIKIKRGYLPPLGIGYLASVLESNGHSVTLIDSAATGLDYSEIVAEVKGIAPDLIGISTLTATAYEAFELAKQLKEQTGKLIVMGGAHPTCFPEEVMRDSKHTDIIAIGEGELIILDLVNCLENKGDLRKVKGIHFRDNTGIVNRNPPTDTIEDLDSIPFPAKHLYKNEFYIPYPTSSKRLPATSMIVTRGCPWHRCKFCFQSGKYRRKYRRRSLENVIAEIKQLTKEFGFKEIVFWDDIFAINTKRILRFCDLLEQEKIDITWTCQGRVDTVTERMLARMGEAGCFTIFYGLESGNQDLLDAIDKGTTLEQARNAIMWTHKAGIEARAGFILALPGENPEKGKKTIDFAIELDLDFAVFALFRPRVGTELYDISLKEGRPVAFKGIHEVAYIPDGYESAEQVKQLVKEAYRRFYLRPHYIWKHIKGIRSLNDVEKYYEGLKLLLGIAFASLETGQGNFWYIGRRDIILDTMKMNIPNLAKSKMLEIGCGDGNVLSFLRENGVNIEGGDISVEGLKLCRQQAGAVPLYQLDAKALPFHNEFDIIGMFDVLEHIDEDEKALVEVYNALKPAGNLLVTIPAHKFLWSYFDEASAHKRRYSRGEIIDKLEQNGFAIKKASYFIAFLFPVFMVIRLLKRHSKGNIRSSVELKSIPVVNEVFLWLLRIEKHLMRHLNLPLGASLLILAEKKDAV